MLEGPEVLSKPKHAITSTNDGFLIITQTIWQKVKIVEMKH
jgi:hypothetical protein